MTQEKSVYSVKEIQELFHLSKASVYNAIKAGTIPSIRIGGRVLIPKVQINRMLHGENVHQTIP